jgi:hypothetical protein
MILIVMLWLILEDSAYTYLHENFNRSVSLFYMYPQIIIFNS